MALSTKDEHDLTLAKSMSCDVLKEAVIWQADNNMLSEAHCELMETAYRKAAATARMRRETANDRFNGNRSIFSDDHAPLRVMV